MKTIRFAILTVSDRASRGQRTDASGPALVEFVESKGYDVVKLDIVPDVISAIQNKLLAWTDSDEADIILTTGGTGVAPRDVTPEATRAVVERLTPGIDEAMRTSSSKVTPHAMLSRAISGIRNRSLIINLPGSPKGAVENFQVVLPVLEHAVKLLRDEDAGH
jgi:molybdenum cofactor synthesis domain-containing protein